MQQLADAGHAASACAFDVTDEAAVAAGVAEIERTAGAIDILVNNAAMNQRKPLPEFAVAEWRALQAANLDGPFLVTRAVLPGMQARRRGKIINICSLASDIGRPNIVPYATSKGALKMLTRALAVEVAPYNVQVNGIAPGFFKTEMNAPLIANAEFSAWVGQAHAGRPLGRAARDRRRRRVPRVAGGRLRHRAPALRRRRVQRVVLNRRRRGADWRADGFAVQFQGLKRGRRRPSPFARSPPAGRGAPVSERATSPRCATRTPDRGPLKPP